MKLPALCLLLPLLAACASSGIPKDLRAQADPNAAFAKVSRDPEAWRGKTVLWGGQILSVKNEKDGTSIEVLQAPVDGKGRPGDIEKTEGRFIAFSDGYLDQAVYAAGRKISVVGELQGARRQPLGEGQADYDYPVVRVRHLKLWPAEKNRPAGPRFGVGVGIGVGL